MIIPLFSILKWTRNLSTAIAVIRNMLQRERARYMNTNALENTSSKYDFNVNAFSVVLLSVGEVNKFLK